MLSLSNISIFLLNLVWSNLPGPLINVRNGSSGKSFNLNKHGWSSEYEYKYRIFPPLLVFPAKLPEYYLLRSSREHQQRTRKISHLYRVVSAVVGVSRQTSCILLIKIIKGAPTTKKENLGSLSGCFAVAGIFPPRFIVVRGCLILLLVLP